MDNVANRKPEVTALNEKSEYTVSLCLGFGEVHTGVCVCMHVQEAQKPQWWGASYQLCCHTCAVNRPSFLFLTLIGHCFQ